jgi:hypothetical protein
LRGQLGAETGRRTSDRRNLRDRWDTSVWGIRRRGRLVTKVHIGVCYFDGIGHDGPFCIHRVASGEDSVRCEDAMRAVKGGRPAMTICGASYNCWGLARATVIEVEALLAVVDSGGHMFRVVAAADRL